MLYHFLRGYTDAIYVAVHLRAPKAPRAGLFAEPPVPIEAQVATCFETLFGMIAWLIRALAGTARWIYPGRAGSAGRRAIAGTVAFVLGVALFAVVAAAGSARATILTFDQGRSATGFDVVPIQAGAQVAQDYGDRVTGSPMDVLGGTYTYGNGGEGFTPNVGVNYLATGGVFLWTLEYGDLTNVIFAGPGSNVFRVQLEADAGFEVVLYGFDLAGWPLTDYAIDAVTVSSNGIPLFSQIDVAVEGDATGPGHTAFGFAAPLMGSELTISLDFSNIPFGQQDNFGLDNIRFGQSPPPEVVPTEVPEPGSLALLVTGLAMLGLRRDRAAFRLRAAV
ncbi:PEP-CTERM sorting domain-containing protein [Pelagibius sp. 7325]|uniref:PEP-CTERM sorting domain-containing protein n=1 Tax=Pelagibius sp. 7325 TaxID=3131994 RepID=UPI0030EF2E19